MGKDKKDKKAKASEKKARNAQRADKKVVQREKKAASRPKNSANDSSEDDDDLDAILASYAAEQERFHKVTEVKIDAPPTARSSATLLANPSNANEVLLFGGETFAGGLSKSFNDLFIYHISRDEWKQVNSPNSPLPRSGHAWTRGGNTGGIYLFGGEFSSPKQGTFYHYGDFWRLDPASREWTKLETRGKGPSSPSPRSGHRMTYFKQYIILYGGFQDTSSSEKYLSDLWLYDCVNFTWISPQLPPASQRPDARSSFSLLPHEQGAVLYGGYSRVAATAAKGKPAQRQVLKPMVHQDAWFLRIQPPENNGVPVVRWERRKRPANAPQPARAGATMAHHKGRGLQFGGVHDIENSEEGIESEFFNSLCVWNVERNRFFTLSLRRPRAPAKRLAAEKGRRGRKADEELFKNLRELEMREGLQQVHEPEEEEEVDARVEKPIIWEMPHPRFNAQIAVVDDLLFIYGGTFEKQDREYTFDEMWCVDLGTLAGAREIFRRDLEDWQEADESSDDEDEDEDDGSSSEATDTEKAPALEEPEPVEPVDKTEEVIESDGRPHPRPFESLRDFYARTSLQWQEVLLRDLEAKGKAGEKSIKEVRKSAFEYAEGKWWDCREEVQALEDEQEEAGIGEIVNLAERPADGSGSVRRR